MQKTHSSLLVCHEPVTQKIITAPDLMCLDFPHTCAHSAVNIWTWLLPVIKDRVKGDAGNCGRGRAVVLIRVCLLPSYLHLGNKSKHKDDWKSFSVLHTVLDIHCNICFWSTDSIYCILSGHETKWLLTDQNLSPDSALLQLFSSLITCSTLYSTSVVS